MIFQRVREPEEAGEKAADIPIRIVRYGSAEANFHPKNEDIEAEIDLVRNNIRLLLQEERRQEGFLDRLHERTAHEIKKTIEKNKQQNFRRIQVTNIEKYRNQLRENKISSLERIQANELKRFYNTMALDDLKRREATNLRELHRNNKEIIQASRERNLYLNQLKKIRVRKESGEGLQKRQVFQTRKLRGVQIDKQFEEIKRNKSRVRLLQSLAQLKEEQKVIAQRMRQLYKSESAAKKLMRVAKAGAKDELRGQEGSTMIQSEQSLIEMTLKQMRRGLQQALN